MFLLNKLRNFINTYPFIRRLFVSLVSIFVIPLLNLQSYLSINGYRRRRKIFLLRKITTLLDKLELKKIIIDKSSTSFFYKNGIAFNIAKNRFSASNTLVFQRNYEINETKLVKGLVKPGWTVIDIGANFGWYSIHFSQLVGPSGKVFSFEPIPDSYEELNSNMQLNSCQNMKTFNTALGNRDDLVSFGIPEIDGGLSASSQFLKCNKQIQATMCRLDNVIEEKNITNVDFIKVDIEGGELDMLYGAEKLLEQFRPNIMIEIVDVHCHRFGYSPNDVYQFLLSKGYSGLFIGNEYTKEKTNEEIHKLTKPNVNNLLNGNYLFNSI